MTGNFALTFLVFYPIIGALVSFVCGRFNKNLRDLFVWFVTLTEAVIFAVLLCGFMANGVVLASAWEGFCGFGLHFTMDGFRALYGTIAVFMWAMTSLLSRQYFGHYRNRNRYYLFLLLTLGATVGVFLSADLYTTFIFFEMMSFTSYVWVAQEEKREALRAAETYLAVAVIGGLVMLMGLFLLYQTVGTLEIGALRETIEQLRAEGDLITSASWSGTAAAFRTRLYAAGGCMLFGFGAKAGMFPLHIWLPKAHPVAPAPASALLSGILTKAGMYGILILSCRIFFADDIWGAMILTLGVFTMVIGAVLAVFSVNLKRTLACSSVSQIGFILVGVGMGCLLGEENGMALRGAMLHMVNHSLIKLVLFMAAGVVFMNIHQLELNRIRGFGRNKWLLQAAFLMGALGIGGIPLWNGYVSKTLIHESIVEYTEMLEEGLMYNAWYGPHAMKAIEWMFLISGGMTVAYMTKLYVALFIEKNADAKLQEKYDAMKATYLHSAGRIALALSAVLLPIMGFVPQIVMNRMADLGQSFLQASIMEHSVHYFSVGNLKGGLISILIGAALYLLVIRQVLMKGDRGSRSYADLWPAWLDLENMIYRPVLLKILPFIFGVLCRILDSLFDWLVVFLRKTIYKDSPLPHELEEGNMISHAVGGVMDLLHGLFFEKRGAKKSNYRHKMALLSADVNENLFLLSRSMSFGLLLFCLGVLATVMYLLFR